MKDIEKHFLDKMFLYPFKSTKYYTNERSPFTHAMQNMDRLYYDSMILPSLSVLTYSHCCSFPNRSGEITLTSDGNVNFAIQSDHEHEVDGIHHSDDGYNE